MHELSVAEELMERLQRLVEREGARGVARVVIRVGAWSGVEAEALRFALPLAAENTCAEGADWVVREEPARVRCLGCGMEFDTDPIPTPCPGCGRDQLKPIGGWDLILESVDLLLD